MIVCIFSKVFEESSPGMIVEVCTCCIDVIETVESRARHIAIECSLCVEVVVRVVSTRLRRVARSRDADHALAHAAVEL